MRTLALALALGIWIGVPAPAAVAAPRGGATTHVVYQGQTLGMIAKRYRVSIDDLCTANRITRRARLKPGQKLAIPAPGAAVVPEPEPATRTATPTLRTAPAAPVRPPTGDGHARTPKRRGHVHLQSVTGEYRGPVFDRKGRLLPAARRQLDRVFAAWRTGDQHPMDPELLRHLVRVSDHFGGRTIRVVSGYRPKRANQYTAHSRHNVGRAVDFSVEGVPNSEVRDFCRTLGAVGVGYYPNSSFVHLDVRERATYWVDFSGPGERPRYANAQGRDPGRGAPQALDPEANEDHSEDEDGGAVPASADAPRPTPAEGAGGT